MEENFFFEFVKQIDILLERYKKTKRENLILKEKLSKLEEAYNESLKLNNNINSKEESSPFTLPANDFEPGILNIEKNKDTFY